MKGLEARKMFFGEKALDLFEGVKIFSYTGPNMRDIDVAAAEQGNQFLMKQFANLVSKDRLVDGAVVKFERTSTSIPTSASRDVERHGRVNGPVGCRGNAGSIQRT
jgi:hypothetical protein